MPLPLEGVRVLELSHIIAGPFCGAVLADYGADIVKVEAPGVGDRTRRNTPFVPGSDPPLNGHFYGLNRSRCGVTLNLKTPEGRAVFRDLVGWADILLENFAPGVMERLGLGYETLREVNPRLIYVAISGFGQLEPYIGPYSQWPANNAIAQGMGGLMDLTGERDGPPTFVGATIGDTIPGLWAAFGAVLALYQRTLTGEGQYVDVPMYDSIVAMCFKAVLDHSTVSGVVPTRGSEGWGGTFTGILRCQDGYIAVSMWGDQPEKWRALWERIGRSEAWEDPRIDQRQPGNTKVAAFIKATLEEWLSTRDRWEGVRMLLDAGFSAGPVQGAREIHDCLQLQARQAHYEIELGGRQVRGPRSPVRLSGSPPRTHRRGPHLGEHTEEVLTQILGRSLEEVRDLRGGGVI
ncbi:MAG: CoA transferase [Chloroflexi bacterium]|nr:CoA transferase [Chloroflexota bacterium]